MTQPLAGILQYIFIPVVCWIALPGLIGGILADKKFNNGRLGFMLGAGLGVFALFLAGPFSR